MERKYECINETITIGDKTLYRIKALKDFGDVKADDLGGFLENEDNLNHEGNCWISDNACVFGDAYVSDNAWVSGNARVYDDARVFGEALICGDARVFGDARISGNAKVSGKADVSGNACVSGDACVYNNAKIYSNAHITKINDYIVIGPIGSRNDFTTFYLTKDKEIMVSCGCFNDTIDEFIKAVNETHRYNDKYKNDYNTVSECVKMLLK